MKFCIRYTVKVREATFDLGGGAGVIVTEDVVFTAKSEIDAMAAVSVVAYQQDLIDRTIEVLVEEIEMEEN